MTHLKLVPATDTWAAPLDPTPGSIRTNGNSNDDGPWCDPDCWC